MNLINLIFNLGVLFSVYSFIWFFINAIIKIITTGRKQSSIEIYFSKGIQYIFLANITFLFGIQNEEINWTNLCLSGLILIMYFVGKLQKNEQKSILNIQFQGIIRSQKDLAFNRKTEIIIIVLSIVIYGFFIAMPELAVNPISEWFYQKIINIEKLPIIGFIFKIIGLFFLLGILIKISNGIMFLFSKIPFFNSSTSFINKENNDEDFDDYEEIK